MLTSFLAVFPCLLWVAANISSFFPSLSIPSHFTGLCVIATVTHLSVLKASPVFGCLIIKPRKVESQ